MATKKFSSELSNRGTVKITDKLMIQNIDTGAVEYSTVAELLTALGLNGEIRNQIQANSTIISSYAADGTTRRWQIDNIDGGISIYIEGAAAYVLTITSAGRVVVLGVPEYTDNAAAIAGGNVVGTFYRTGDALKIVH